MNTAAKIMCIITVVAFCSVGILASPDEKASKLKELSAEEDKELAYCLPGPADVSSTLNLAQVDPDPTYTGR